MKRILSTELPAHAGAIRPGEPARHIRQRRQEREAGRPIAQDRAPPSLGLVADRQPVSGPIACEPLYQPWRYVVCMEIERQRGHSRKFQVQSAK